MPNENIERAILRGTGNWRVSSMKKPCSRATPRRRWPADPGSDHDRNRIVGEFRHLMTKNGGNMAEAGAVGWMFHRKEEITVPKEAASEEKLLDLVLEAGAEDMKDDGSAWYIVTPPESLETVKESLAKAGITPASA